MSLSRGRARLMPIWLRFGATSAAVSVVSAPPRSTVTFTPCPSGYMPSTAANRTALGTGTSSSARSTSPGRKPAVAATEPSATSFTRTGSNCPAFPVSRPSPGIRPCFTSPPPAASSRGSQSLICRALIAKPSPVLLRRPNRVLIWPLMPTTRPPMSMRGPPELPGLTSVSVTMHSV